VYQEENFFAKSALCCFFYLSKVFFGILNNHQVSSIQHQAYAGSLLPEGLVIEDGFEPGVGTPVGNVELVQGEVIIIHENTLSGYPAENDLPLFEGDVIITRKRGRIRFKLKDESILTLASETKLVLNRSVYDPAKKTRSSFMNMALGKARFWVKKLFDFKRSEFKVKTKTAIVGVRGSDFIVIAGEKRTEVTALEKTDLEIVSLVGPDQGSVIHDFERIVIKESALPSQAEELFIEEIEVMKRAFTITPGSIEPEGEAGVQEVKIKAPAFKEPAIEKEPFEPVKERGIRVSDDDLVKPESLSEMEHHDPEAPEAHHHVVEEEGMPREEKHEEIHREHQEEKKTEEIKKLADFPKVPPVPKESE